MTDNHTYGESVLDFGAGDRVELHPATDARMRGERYGTVSKSQRGTRTLMRVELDSWRIARFSPSQLRLRYGTVSKIRRGTTVRVELDSGRVASFSPSQLRLL